MATAFLSPILFATSHVQSVTAENCESIIKNGLPKSAFLFANSDFAASTTLCSSSLQGKAAVSRKFKICAHKSSFDHIPKQFRQENLKDGGEFVSHFLHIFIIPLGFVLFFFPCSILPVSWVNLISRFVCLMFFLEWEFGFDAWWIPFVQINIWNASRWAQWMLEMNLSQEKRVREREFRRKKASNGVNSTLEIGSK